jgi:HEAT repeat protein
MMYLHIVLVGIVAMLSGCYTGTAPEPEVVVPRLIALLQDPNPDLRQTAALSLGKIASAEAASSLILSLRDADPSVRQYSAWALGNLGKRASSEAASALIVLLDDPVSTVADAAAQAIGSIGAEPEAVTHLLTILREGSDQARRAAIAVLGVLESPLAYNGLLSALADHDADLRQGAVAALGELGDRRAIPGIEARLRLDSSGGVRTEAAYRLGIMSDEGSLPILRAAAAEDPNERVRRWAQRAIEALTAPAGPGSTT